MDPKATGVHAEIKVKNIVEIKRKKKRVDKLPFYSSYLCRLQFLQGRMLYEWTVPGRGETNGPKLAIIHSVCSRDPCRLRARPNLIVRSPRFGKVILCRAHKLNLNLTLPPRPVAAQAERCGFPIQLVIYWN